MSHLLPRRIFLPIALIILGVLAITSAIAPISYDLGKYILDYDPPLVDPLVSSSGFSPIVLNSRDLSTDFTQASSWFVSPPALSTASASVEFFSLSIPRLDMNNIPVEVNGSDLKKNAIHFPGTAIPGDWGNSVVFGHSSLPQFYRPGNPVTIFNRLPGIRTSDNIIVMYDGIVYRYKVSLTMEITPQDIQVLEQKFDRRQLTLVTCVPLGTYWRRFVAIAQLVN